MQSLQEPDYKQRTDYEHVSSGTLEIMGVHVAELPVHNLLP
jgi:hypothetical protein